MPKFVIERNVPGVGALSSEEWCGLAQKSCATLEEMGPKIQWVHSYVTADRIYCVYIAPDEETIREHARRTGIPADRVSRVDRVVDPTTSEAPVGSALV